MHSAELKNETLTLICFQLSPTDREKQELKIKVK